MATTSTSTTNPFPPSRQEDTVFFTLYPSLPSSEPVLSSLQSVHLQILSLLSPFLSSYIFHHDPFSLSVPTSSSSSSIPHLHGKLRFGDCLLDEWFLVSLLFHATASIPNLVARVWDSDGEFLLIEAAFSLPRWLSSDSAAVNRVFIFNGDLHIVTTSLFPETPTLSAALDAVRDDSIDTRAPDAVQAAVKRRIDGLPQNAAKFMHRVRVLVPSTVAQVLRHEPCLIARAVEGFYDRDIDRMKYAAKMERFLKGSAGDGGVEMVRVSVTMSRTMYGQLVMQGFQAPRGYPMPRREDVGQERWLEAELGMKIACGFEMMYQARKKDGEEGTGSTWEAFRKSLEASGCFDGLLPGSQEYKRIMENALRYYKSTSLFSRTRYFRWSLMNYCLKY